MRPIEKGAIVGVSAGVSIAIAMAISITQGLRTESLLAHEGESVGVEQALCLLLGVGTPIGAAFGTLLSTVDLAVWRRTAFAMVSLLGVLLWTPLWPDLMVPGAPIAIAHGLALAR